MEYPASLIERLGELDPESFSGRVFRWTFEGIPAERHNTRGARWNPPGTAALYTGLSRDVVELESNYLIEAQGIAPTRERQMHTLLVQLAKVLRLTRSRLAVLGIDDSALTSSDHSKCQLVGGAVERLRFEGLLIPSARGPADNLVIFPSNLPFGESLFKVESSKQF